MFNKSQLIGNLGKDPDIRYTPEGKCVASISVATSESYKDKASGQRKQHTEWHRVVMFDGLAELAKQHLKSGAQVFIEGKLRTRKWQDKQSIDHYVTEIVAMDFKMLGKSPASSKPTSTTSSNGNELPYPDYGDFDDEPEF